MTYAAPQPQAAQVTGTSGAPLSQPLYGASFGQAFGRFWKKYATFSGRASRSEFWWWFLANALIVTVIGGIMIAGGVSGSVSPTTGDYVPGPLLAAGGILLLVWILATLIPRLALTWRRLHDANLAGPFWFLSFVPGVGDIIVLVLTVLPSNPAGARFDR